MKIVFMGTPVFAVKSLERLYNDGYDIACVFTQADKPRNRGMKTSFSPVKEFASIRDIPVHQPLTLKDNKSADIIRETGCDLIVVVAYGKLLPKEILTIPPLECINIHGSLLPKYRGAAPVQHTIINGEKITGVTSQYISEAMDAGDIILTKSTDIGDDETSLQLSERLSDLSAELLSETVEAIASGTVKRYPQDHNEATYAPLLTKDMSPVDWTKSAYQIKNKVRGLIPWPVATMSLNNETLKIYAADADERDSGKKPGSIISSGSFGIEIACGNGTLTVKELQAPGGKRMYAAEYIKGNPVVSEWMK